MLITGFPAIVELLGATPEAAFGASIVGLVLLTLLTPAFGALSDRIGRRPLLLLGFSGSGPMIATALAQRGITFTMTAYFLVMFISAAIIVTRSREEILSTR